MSQNVVSQNAMSQNPADLEFKVIKCNALYFFMTKYVMILKRGIKYFP